MIKMKLLSVISERSKSKKGFTLVELVVVIAILAVLAAIAIPAVIGIINSANESQRASDAASLDYACKSYYSGLVSGTITSNTFTPTKSSDTVPSALDPASTRLNKARNCTVAGAMEYAGLYEQLIGRAQDFGYDYQGNIYSTSDEANTGRTITALPADAKVTFNTLNYV